MSRLRRLGRIAFYGSGADTLASGAKSTGRVLGLGASILSGFRRRSAAPSEAEARIAALNNRRVAFAAAAEAAGLDEAALRKAQRAEFAKAALMGCLLAVLAAVGTLSARNMAPVFGWVAAVGASFAPCILVGALLLRACYYNHLYRSRSLTSLGAWLRQPGAWLPRLALAVAVAAALTPGNALAAGGGILDQLFGAPGEQDIAAGWVRALQQTDGPVAAMAAIISAMALTLGSMVLAVQTIQGMVQAAQTGTLLSGRINTVWGPVHAALGVGMAAPLGGFCAAQLVVFSLAFGGIQGGNAVLSAVIGTVAEGKGDFLPPAGQPGASAAGIRLVETILRAEVCANSADINDHYRTLPDSAAQLPAVEGSQGIRVHLWAYGVGCGTLTIPTHSEPEAAKAFSDARISAISAAVSAIRASWLPVEIAAGASPGQNIPWPEEIRARVESIARAYDDSMRSAARTYAAAKGAAGRSALVADAQKLGWLSAGAYSRALAQMSAETAALAAEPAGLLAPRRGELSGQRAGIEEALRRFDQAWRKESDAAALSGAEIARAADESDWLARLSEPYTKPLLEATISLGSGSGADPIGEATAFGHRLLGVADGGLVAVGGLGLAAKTLPADAAGLDGAFEVAWDTVKIPALMLILVGGLYAYVLPMIPFVHVVFLGINWVTALAEALALSPILAMQFIRLDGQAAVSDPQRPGILLLFSLLMYPALGMLGFGLSFVLATMFVNFLHTYGPAIFIANQGGHLVGLWGAIFGLVLMAWLEWQIITRSFALIHQIPDQCLRWLGGPVQDRGGDSQVGAVVAPISRGTMTPASRAAHGGMQTALSKLGGGRGGSGGGSISPVGGGAGGAWFKGSGGLAGLSAGQRAAAEKAYGQWEHRGQHSLGDYVGYVQEQEAKRS